ncbi:Mu-like prophage protein gp29 [Cedecea neteri]|uniref:Mu-like prophage protein gp29 n=1 Tax=Cedecea neteri TaxID=158822 RepID=A0A2X3IM36_9ENTR|nr:Mu-like prophage protein gp29 [Cedecea neteri]
MDIKSLFKRLVGRGEDTAEPVQSGDYPMLYLDHQGHPSTGLDVQKVYLCLKAAEDGDLVLQSDLFTDMEERDGHLFAELSKRKRALLTLPFAVKPPKDATEAEITLAAEAEGWIRNLPGFSEMLIDMLDAIGHGFACVEIEWGQRGGLWMPVAFHKRPARAFTVAMYNHDDIRLNTGTNADGEPLWETGWIVHRHRAKSGPVAQSGLFRVLVWPYLFKNLSARDWAQFLNLYGLPFRIGKYDSSMDEKARSRLLQGIRMMARNGGGIIPQRGRD